MQDYHVNTLLLTAYLAVYFWLASFASFLLSWPVGLFFLDGASSWEEAAQKPFYALEFLFLAGWCVLAAVLIHRHIGEKAVEARDDRIRRQAWPLILPTMFAVAVMIWHAVHSEPIFGLEYRPHLQWSGWFDVPHESWRERLIDYMGPVAIAVVWVFAASVVQDFRHMRGRTTPDGFEVVSQTTQVRLNPRGKA